MPSPQTYFLFLLTLCAGGGAFSTGALPAEIQGEAGWKPLFNGKDLSGWHAVLRNGRTNDAALLVQVHDGVIHMYPDAAEGSAQPAGYIVTAEEFANYRLRLEYRWGKKRFAPRTTVRRDAGILYLVTGDETVWPTSVEFQIQENDVGDIYTINTRLTASVDSGTTNLVNVPAAAGAGQGVHASLVARPVFRASTEGGVFFVQGIANGIRRVIRSSMAEQEGWNSLELFVSGNKAIQVVNGKTNNRASNIERRVEGRWEPLARGKIGLQLEYAEVQYRNIRILELKE